MGGAAAGGLPVCMSKSKRSDATGDALGRATTGHYPPPRAPASSLALHPCNMARFGATLACERLVAWPAGKTAGRAQFILGTKRVVRQPIRTLSQDGDLSLSLSPSVCMCVCFSVFFSFFFLLSPGLSPLYFFVLGHACSMFHVPPRRRQDSSHYSTQYHAAVVSAPQDKK